MTEPQPNLQNDLRDELLAAAQARRELAPEDEQYLIDHFLTRLDREIESRIDARIQSRLASVPRGAQIEPWVVPAALGVAIPICAISAAAAGVWGLLIGLGFVLAVIAIYAEYNRR